MKVLETLELIRWLVLDVDGTMTDGGIYLDGNGIETKKFTVQDGAGIDVSHLADGVYIVTAQVGSEVHYKKIVKAGR